MTLRDPRPHDNGPDFTSRLFARFPSAVASWLNSLLLALVQEEESSITTRPLSRTPPFFHSISRHSIHEDIMEAVPLRHRTPTNSIACLIAYVPFSLLSRNSEDESHPLRRGENFVPILVAIFLFLFSRKISKKDDKRFYRKSFVASDCYYLLFYFERCKIDF